MGEDPMSLFDKLVMSNFVLCTGSGGPYSWNLLEALAAGAVPVVTQDMILPWEDHDLDWNTCVVRVNEQELYSLPHVLSIIVAPGSREYTKKQAGCRGVWQFLSNATWAMEMRFPTSALRGVYERHVHEIFWRMMRRRFRQAAGREFTEALNYQLGPLSLIKGPPL